MARNHDPDCAEVYEAAQRWVQQCLANDGSLFTSGAGVWSSQWLGELHTRFVEHPDETSDAFLTKLERQLRDSPGPVYQLMAEVIYVHFLVASKESIGGDRKREHVNTVLGWSPEPVTLPDELSVALDYGLAATGTAFHTLRPFQLQFVIEFALSWKSLKDEERERLLNDPWAFKSMLWQVPMHAAYSQRLALLHLVHPDTFEPIVSRDMKKRISESYGDRVSEPVEDVDRQLSQIRASLAEEHGSDFNFWDEGIRDPWQPSDPTPWSQLLTEVYGVAAEDLSPEEVDEVVAFLQELLGVAAEDVGSVQVTAEQLASLQAFVEDLRQGGAEPDDQLPDAWDEYVGWAARFFGDPSFDEVERDYKLVIAERLQSASRALQEGRDDWPDLLKKAFGAPNNLTFFINHARLLEWVQENPDEAGIALTDLWASGDEIGTRVQRFTDHLTEVANSPGSRVELASFLLLRQPAEYMFYKPTAFKTSAALVGFPSFPSQPEAAIYTHALDFVDTFIQQATDRGLALRDRLDAQGLMWAVTKTKPEDLQWPETDIEEFLRWRGDRPAVWWVNQGRSFDREHAAKVVSAPLVNRAGQVLQYHSNVSRLRKGDVILHHAGGQIRAISQVSHKPTEGNRPWDKDGKTARIARTTYFDLTDPIDTRGIDVDRRIAESGPFDAYGGVKQVYLAPLSPAFSQWIHEAYAERWPPEAPWGRKRVPTWLFQARHDVWDMPENIRAMAVGDEDTFTVTRFKSEISPGDRILLWQSGPEAGLHGVGEITSELFEPPEDDRWGDAESQLSVLWQLTRHVDPPLRREQLLDNQVLKGLSVITAPQGTNFQVTDEQWSELRRLLDGAVPLPSGPELTLGDISAVIADKGLVISDRMLRRFHLSLHTRGFVILSGLSGSGKTWLTEVYAEAAAARYLLVPVAPNWTTNEDLIGYRNPIDGEYHHTAFSRFLIEAAEEYQDATASQRPARRFILTLDEMNLARIEYYFARFLSAMEVRMRQGTASLTLADDVEVELTPNLWFIGTVNVDETTHGFADKVYDRAQLIELDVPRDAIAGHIGSGVYREELLDVYDAVADAKPFAFRIVDEIKAYVAECEEHGVVWTDALDEQVLQKIVPRLTGADPAIRYSLESLLNVAEEHGLELTRAKTRRMLNGYDRDGFASYF